MKRPWRGEVSRIIRRDETLRVDVRGEEEKYPRVEL